MGRRPCREESGLRRRHPRGRTVWDRARQVRDFRGESRERSRAWHRGGRSGRRQARSRSFLGLRRHAAAPGGRISEIRAHGDGAPGRGQGGNRRLGLPDGSSPPRIAGAPGADSDRRRRRTREDLGSGAAGVRTHSAPTREAHSRRHVEVDAHPNFNRNSGRASRSRW